MEHGTMGIENGQGSRIEGIGDPMKCKDCGSPKGLDHNCE
jgi:hypothetical protein